MINKKKTREIFHNKNVQINIDALNIIEREIQHMIEVYAKRAESEYIKRVTPDNVHMLINLF
tara:strand:+ start:484 stop:669 length:186 start_codon:yes stop_codon:yes gene_type:complete